MVLTPDHRVPYFTDHIKNKLQIKTMQTLYDMTESVKPSKTTNKKLLRDKFIPSTFNNTNVINKLRLTNTELQLLTAIQADGSIVYRTKTINKIVTNTKAKRAIHFNLKKSRKVKRLIQILDHLKAQYNVTKLSNGYHRFYLTSHKHCWFKDITLLYNCTKEQCKIVYEESIHWDGSKIIRDSGLITHLYCCSIKKNTDVMQFIYTSATSKAASFSANYDETVWDKKLSMFYVSSTIQTQKSMYREDISKIQITNSYCFTTSTGFWLARRNNFIFPTGNSGKSSLLEGVAKAHNNHKVVYLVFNKEQELDAKQRFNSDVKVSTTHAFAYYYVITLGLQLNKNRTLKKTRIIKRKLGNFGVGNITENIPSRDKEKVVYWLDKFCQSRYITVKDYCVDQPKALKRIELINKYLGLMATKKIDCTFAFNLKYLHLLAYYKVINFNTNVLLLDECQDSSEVVLEIFKLIQAKHKVAVGDKYQQLYSFAGAVNGFDYLQDQKPKQLKLTKSFRVTTKVAKKIETFGRLYFEPNFKFTGTDNNIDNGLTAYLSRSNANLILKMMQLQASETPYRLTRTVKSIFETVKVIMFLNKKGVYNPKYSFLNRGIDDFYGGKPKAKTLIAHIKKEYDYHTEVQSAISIVLKVGNAALKRTMETAEKNAKRPEYKTAKTILATSFTTKGMTISKVHVDADILPKDDILQLHPEERTIQENEALNLMYVSYSRSNSKQNTAYLDIAIDYKL